MIRILNVIAVLLLIGSAVGAYRIKYEATLKAEKVAKLRLEIRREKEAIALLRAEFGQLSRPDRIQALAARYTELKPFDLARLERLERIDQIPDKPPPPPDPIGDIIEEIDRIEDPAVPTSAVPQPRSVR